VIRRAVLVTALLAFLLPGCAASTDVRPDCRGEDPVFALAAQAVPSASLLPCLDALLTGWDFAGSQVVDGAFRFWLASDRAGMKAVEVELLTACDVSNAVEVIAGPDEIGTRRFEEPISLGPSYAANRYYTFPGGCVKVEYRFDDDDTSLVLQADQAISFRPRQELVDRYADVGLILCGFGATGCAGGD
jgi:hypothetical protein